MFLSELVAGEIIAESPYEYEHYQSISDGILQQRFE